MCRSLGLGVFLQVVDGKTVQLLQESGAPGLKEDAYQVGERDEGQQGFGGDARQKEVYENTVGEIVKEFCDGINTSVAAFGQSSAGKTHTLVGKEGLLQ